MLGSTFFAKLHINRLLLIVSLLVVSCNAPPNGSENQLCSTPICDPSTGIPYETYSVVSVFPSLGSVDVSLDSEFKVQFSEPINFSSVDSTTFTIIEMFPGGSVPISGGYWEGSSDTELVFTPFRNLAFDSTYDAKLLTGVSGIRSISGKVLLDAPNWNLVTMAREVDQDRDGISDNRETNQYNTNPTNSDSDGDGLNDYAEILAGLNPNDGSDATVDRDSVTDPMYTYQWHLDNFGQSSGATNGGTVGEDIKIQSAWSVAAGTRDIVISIVDTGIDASHPDLMDNLNINLSYRYSDGSSDPSPTGEQLTGDLDSPHGTACAGIAGARGWNREGIRGVAPFAQLAGLNVFSDGAVSSFIDALGRTNIDISSNSWGPSRNWEMAVWDDIDAIEQGIALGRQGKGVIYVFAAGNQDPDGFNANVGSNVHNSRFVINVGAVDANGVKASYSNFGSNVLISAPGGGSLSTLADPTIVTTDLHGLDLGWDDHNTQFFVHQNQNGNYTNLMNGTSSATPIIAGVAALILQVNPDLTYRDIRYILATTARKTDLGDILGWQSGMNGNDYNPRYGYGIVDAAAAVEKAKGYSLLSSEKSTIKRDILVNRAIPEDGETVISSIDIDDSFTIENVYIWVTTTHLRTADLQLILEAPSGKESRLTYYIGEDGIGSALQQYDNWQFLTVRHLDENSKGSWKLKVKDLSINGFTGDFIGWSLQIFGR